MRLYRTNAAGTYKWAGSQSEAAKQRKEFVAAGTPRKHVDTVEVDVPTKKEDLMAWLNTNVNKYQD